ILGYIGGNSFVYGGIGLIICAVLLAALIVLMRKGKPIKRRSANTEPVTQNTASANGKLDDKDWRELKDSFSGHIYFGNLNVPNIAFSADNISASVDKSSYECTVVVHFSIDRDKVIENNPGLIGSKEPDYKGAEKDIDEAYDVIQKWFDGCVSSLQEGKYGRVRFSLEIK
ncbi:MAG: hypothetical protein LUD27_06190, partial [Clostridia bacterium]|nr:hypothetical protein [Clostridia bacterium]